MNLETLLKEQKKEFDKQNPSLAWEVNNHLHDHLTQSMTLAYNLALEEKKVTAVPFIAFRDSELGETLTEKARCPKCNEEHAVEYGTNSQGEISKMLGFVTCGESTYLVGINGSKLTPNPHST